MKRTLLPLALCAIIFTAPPAAAIFEADIYGSSMEGDGGGSLFAWAALLAFGYLFYLYSISRGWNEKAAPVGAVFIWFAIEIVLVILDEPDLYFALCWLVIILAGLAFVIRLFDDKPYIQNIIYIIIYLFIAYVCYYYL